jgi:hypothetical protein
MNCFYHPDKPAIGICNYCYKGLCSHCASDLDFGLACKEKHEDQVRATNKLIIFNTTPQKRLRRGQWFYPTFYTFMGAVFTYYGYERGGIDYFATILGIGFVVTGIGLYVYQKILNRKFLKEYNA